MKVTIRKSDYEKMLSHARSVWPEEACGLIAGIDHIDDTDPDAKVEIREIRKVYLLENRDHTNVHFSLDPGEHLKAVVDMRKHHLKPLGNWHSHPETPSRSSAEDIRLASFDHTASYLILSLMDKEHPVLHSFHVENGVSTPEALEIIPG